MVLSPQLYEDPTVHWNRSLKSSLRGSRTGFPGQEGTGSSCLGVSRRWGLPRPGGSLEGSLEMVVLDPQLPGLVSDPEMEAKAGESPCAELAPAALALPWPEMGSPSAGDPSQEAEELFEQAPDQEEQAETDTEEEPESEPEPKSSSRAKRTAIGAAVGIGVAVLGAPVAIWAAGFTGAGIAAGSIAAKMMSAAAIANGGGVAAGSLVATLQSAGAAGLSLGANIGLGTALGSVGAAVGSWFSKK